MPNLFSLQHSQVTFKWWSSLLKCVIRTKCLKPFFVVFLLCGLQHTAPSPRQTETQSVFKTFWYISVFWTYWCVNVRNVWSRLQSNITRHKDMNREWGRSQASLSERDSCVDQSRCSLNLALGPPLSLLSLTQQIHRCCSDFNPGDIRSPLAESPWCSALPHICVTTVISNMGHMGTETMDNIFHMFTRCWRSAMEVGSERFITYSIKTKVHKAQTQQQQQENSRFENHFGGKTIWNWKSHKWGVLERIPVGHLMWTGTY